MDASLSSATEQYSNFDNRRQELTSKQWLALLAVFGFIPSIVFGSGYTSVVKSDGCRARDDRPCVAAVIEPLPAGLPVSLRLIAQRFLLSSPDDPAQQYDDVRSLVASWLKSWQAVYRTQDQIRYGLGTPWNLERRVRYLEIKSERPWGCLRLSESVYAGGSHSQQRLASHLLDIQTDKEIVWQDLLANNVAPAAFITYITTIVDAAYPERRKNQPLRLQHIVPDGIGIGFWWNPYELGHYSIDRRGTPRVLVTWKKLEVWLDPKRIPQGSK